MQDLTDYLGEEHKDAVEDGSKAMNAASEETEGLIKSLGGDLSAPKGWGHTFSNGAHGQDMAQNNGKLAKERAKAGNQKMIGVWVNNDEATKLIEAMYSMVNGASANGEYFKDLALPERIAVAYGKNGETYKCDGIFMKVKDGIVVTAYPAVASQMKMNTLTRLG
jgi:hypothetical protein